MSQLEQLLKPVSEAAPCGESLAFSPDLDAIAQARKADDPSLEQGAWVTTLKEADWKFVSKRCAVLIETRSKDLQLAVWLAEANAKTGGLRGLGDALQLIGALCERYWDGLYPLPDEDGFEQRIGNLSWIAARVPQLVTECPVTEGAVFSMRQIGAMREAARTHGADAIADVEAARSRTSKAFSAKLLEDGEHCLAMLAQMETALDSLLGNDGPSFSNARTALQNLVHFVTPAAGKSMATAAPPAAEPESGTEPLPTLPAGAVASGPLPSRSQALAQLRAVAEFFRRTEPHSPVAYLADKAASWGEQPLHVWLKTVVKDAAALSHVDELLGIEREGKKEE